MIQPPNRSSRTQPRRPGTRPGPHALSGHPVRPLSDAEMAELQGLLDGVPDSLEPLDLSSVDGYLCGVIVQPQPVAETAWWPRVLDVDGRPPPAGFQAARLRVLVGRRHGELANAVARRQWFDPWVFELEAEVETGAEAGVEDEDDGDGDGDGAAVDAVYPWVTGFTLALETFPRLLERDGPEVSEPLALIYRHLGADNLDDADELQAQIEALEPPADLAAAVEELVRATLLLADAAGLPTER